jgi:hypothetical protein
MINDFAPNGVGDYLPVYVPGNERWRISVWYSKENVVLGGLTVYAIVRDEQKLFESKFG